VYAFKQEGSKYYAQKTNLLNPSECGIPVDRGQEVGQERGSGAAR
jgi:hypothetical protein